jgi:hypothetical protein
MKSRELLSATIDELTLEESRAIDGGGNPITNLIQAIISSPAGPTMGNCVTCAKNFFSPTVTVTPTIGVGCTKR